ncbi:related to scs2-required for inositolmetabolism [Lichtheimia corymbifera JMRC:FSU:9682]|uniref:Related to scs2-required for inositolmetabolism n=1 Tax=Lichtheimia corymbifera JMRC:FSU:9682 TaxID=1263082 RepID=A0A068S1V7_9FUNG|nr:related to scs2-required for inositolmetabolism [Lichtheimia corymbifera JMRC:FSU:9682]
MSVQLNPEAQLTFKRPLTQVTKELLLVTNNNDDPVMFKVKTTAPKQYCVRPNAGRIEPKSQVEVQVILQPFKEEPPSDFKCKDKFLVQTAVIKPAHEALPIAEMWSLTEQEDRQGIFQQKIKCVFLPPEEQPAQQEEQPAHKEQPAVVEEHQAEPVEPVTATATTAPAIDTIPPPAQPPAVEVPKEEEKVEPKPEPIPAAAVDAAPPVVEEERKPEPVVAEPKPTPVAAPAPLIVDQAPEPKPRSMPAAAAPIEKPVVEEKPIIEENPVTNEQPPQPIVTEKKHHEEDSEKKTLKDELQSAREMIEQLRKQVTTLQKEQEATGNGGKGSRKLASTVQPLDAVHQHLAALEKPNVTEGYPPQVVLAVAALVFVFTYLFF